MQLRNKKADREIYEWVVSCLEQITVVPGECRYNFMCHMNAIHEAKKSKEKRIAMCFHIKNGSPIIHFINVNEYGVFVDNTLGHLSSEYTYYLIKYVKEDEFFNIDNIFLYYRKYVRRSLSFWNRLLSNINF